MKAVVFVCLLSLSVCLSESTSKPGILETNATPDNKNETAKASGVPTIQNSTELASKSPPSTNSTTPSQIAPASNSTQEGTAVSAPVSQQNGTAPAANEQKTPEKPEAATTKSNNDTKMETLKPGSSKDKTIDENKSGEKGNNTVPTTETAIPTMKPTGDPKAATEKPLVAARGFDGPSFIGGIVLTLGLLAIGFMGFKYYKNQTERNYHTL